MDGELEKEGNLESKTEENQKPISQKYSNIQTIIKTEKNIKKGGDEMEDEVNKEITKNESENEVLKKDIKKEVEEKEITENEGENEMLKDDIKKEVGKKEVTENESGNGVLKDDIKKKIVEDEVKENEVLVVITKEVDKEKKGVQENEEATEDDDKELNTNEDEEYQTEDEEYQTEDEDYSLEDVDFDEEYQIEDEVFEDDDEIVETLGTESGESNIEKNFEDEIDDPNFKLEELLQSKIKLSDENECLIFSRGPRYSESDWPINCHLCKTPHIITNGELKKHINTPTHQEKLLTVPDAETFRKTPLIQPFCKPFNRLNNPLKIFPGEFIEAVTPDFYNRLQKVEEFEFRKPFNKKLMEILEDEPIHDYNEHAPILGLSYILKFKGPVTNIEYFCLLCMTKCIGEAYQHLVSSSHQMKYIRTHFPNLYKKVKEKLGPYKSDMAQERYVRIIFRKIYRKFEELRGLRKVHIIFYKDYVTGKIQHFKKFQFRKLVHYDEKMLEIPDAELDEWIEKCKKGEIIIEPDSVSLRRFCKIPSETDMPNKKRWVAPPWKRDNYSPPRKFAREESPRVYDTPNNWDRYRRMVGAVLDDLDKEYEGYEDVPEKHPDYEIEWKKYWRRRSKELERDNIDPSYYDFKPEWLDYWADLLKDFHKKEIAKSKYEIKRKLHLPLDKHSPSPIRRRRSKSPQRSRSRSRPRRGSPPRGNYYRGRKRFSQSLRSYDHHRQRREDEPPHNAVHPEPLSVLSVLRQLTVLEDELGSLGPKALEYLSRAVLFEKERNKSADELMREKEFYVFFVTVKEKLKGQLMVNVIERAKMRTANNVIRDLDKLLNSFENYMRNNPSSSIFNRSYGHGTSNMGNQMQYMPSPRHMYNANNMGGGNMGNNMTTRQVAETASSSRSFRPSTVSKPSKSDEEENEIIEAPPPPRNLFNVKSNNTSTKNQIDSFQQRSTYNPPSRNFNSANESSPVRNQFQGSPMGPRMSGGNFNRPPVHQYMSDRKGGAWPSGSQGNYGGGGGFKPNYQFHGNRGMTNFSRQFSGGFRGSNPHNIRSGNSSFRGHHSFNN